MTRSQTNRIEEIIRNQDVRDPRLTLDAIAAILAEKPSIKPEPELSAFEKLMAAMLASVEDTDDEIPHLVPGDVQNEFGDPVATIRIYNTEPRPGKLNVCVAIDYCDNHIEPRHFVALNRMISEFADKKIEQMRHQEGGE